MLKILSDNLVNPTVCLLLVAVFLTTFPAGKKALAFCLEEQENHIVGQNFYLADCHTALDTPLTLLDEHCSVLFEEKNNDCIDVSLSNGIILNRPSKIVLPVSSNVTISYTLPNGLVSLHQQVTSYRSSALSQPLFVLPHIDAHRTVVLLI